MSNVAINIAAEFKGKKAFNDAAKATGGLEKTVGSLAKKLVALFVATKTISMAKISVKAFAADEAAARRLAIAVDNLGLSYSKTKVADFISGLETSAGIADDVLRPAMQALLTTTGSLTKSQTLLNNAIQISRASGVELSTVSQDLANGYVGITKGLKKYNTGLTQAELKSKSFADILGILLTNSAGAANAYLDTTEYKLAVLGVAADNARESIGRGLVDAFAKMSGGTEASDAAKTINNIAKAINAITGAVGGAIGGITKLYGKLDNFVQNFDPLFGDSLASQKTRKVGRSASPAGTARRTAQQRIAEVAAAKRAKDLYNIQQKQVKAQQALLAEQKKQAALKKAAGVFDIEQANLIAALTRGITKEEETRAKAQLALLNGNEAVATSLTKQILMSQDATGALYKLWQTLPDAKNPFLYLEAYLVELGKKAATALSLTLPIAAPIGTDFMNSVVAQSASNVPASPFPRTQPGDFRRAEEASNRTGPIQVVVQLDGQTIAQSNQNQSLSGTPSAINRTLGMFSG
jgi:hypothetical protein